METEAVNPLVLKEKTKFLEWTDAIDIAANSSIYGDQELINLVKVLYPSLSHHNKETVNLVKFAIS